MKTETSKIANAPRQASERPSFPVMPSQLLMQQLDAAVNVSVGHPYERTDFVTTCTKLYKVVQSCTKKRYNFVQVVPSCTKLYKAVQSCSKLYKVVQSCTMTKVQVVQSCTQLYKVVQSCTKLYPRRSWELAEVYKLY